MDEQITEVGTSKLKLLDYAIVGIVLSISSAIGIYYRFTGGRQRTAEEYFSADRSMKIVPLGIALTVSFMSAITLLGISAEVYVHGMIFVLFYLGFVIGTPISMYCYLPVFFELKLMSVYEVIDDGIERSNDRSIVRSFLSIVSSNLYGSSYYMSVLRG